LLELPNNLCVRNETGNYCSVKDAGQKECVHYVQQDTGCNKCFYAEWHRDSRYVCKCGTAIKFSEEEHKCDYTLCEAAGDAFVCLGTGFYSMSQCEYSDMSLEKCKFSVQISSGYVCRCEPACLEAKIKDI